MSEFVRGGSLLACTVFLFFLVPSHSWLAWVFGSLVFVSLLYVGAATGRATTRLELTPVGLTQTAGLFTRSNEKAVSWAKLEALQLRFFSTRWDRSNGWFELTLSDNQSRIKVMSSLSDFDRILVVSQHAAQTRRLDLNPATQENLSKATSYRRPFLETQSITSETP